MVETAHVELFNSGVSESFSSLQLNYGFQAEATSHRRVLDEGLTGGLTSTEGYRMFTEMTPLTPLTPLTRAMCTDGWRSLKKEKPALKTNPTVGEHQLHKTERSEKVHMEKLYPRLHHFQSSSQILLLLTYTVISLYYTTTTTAPTTTNNNNNNSKYSNNNDSVVLI